MTPVLQNTVRSGLQPRRHRVRRLHRLRSRWSVCLCCVALCGTVPPAWSAKAVCKPAQVKADMSKDGGRLRNLFSNLGSSNCASLMTVLASLADTTVDGGRRLEPPKPLDLAAAEAQWRSVRQTTEFADALKDELAGESDATRRLILEAALLDDFGHYKARDLLVLRLKRELAP